jgi:hypothetical protein
LRREAKILYYNRFVTEKKQLILKESEEILKLLITTSEEKFSNNQSQLQTIYKAKARLAELSNMLLMLDQMHCRKQHRLKHSYGARCKYDFQIDTVISARQLFVQHY